MWKNWIAPALLVLTKYLLAVAVLTAVWVGSAWHHERTYKTLADEVIRVRVLEACQRPEYVRTEQDAKRFDLTTEELDLIRSKTNFVNRRLEHLLDEAERVEILQREYAQGKVRPGGVGGPAPKR